MPPQDTCLQESRPPRAFPLPAEFRAESLAELLAECPAVRQAAAPARGEETIRRLLDSVLAALLLGLAAPLLLGIAVAVKRASPGPLFYRQTRVGRGGRLFQIWKFRTMQPEAEAGGLAVTAADDRRVTPVGRFLRDSKLDELPQLWNVLRGDMSLVGPRPQVPRFVACFGPLQRAIVLGVRPGITGPTALAFRREEVLLADRADREGFYITEVLPVKLAMDARYVQTRSLRGDLGILARTAWLFSAAPVRRAAHRLSPRRQARQRRAAPPGRDAGPR